MDPVRETALNGICRLERELLIRDFMTALNDAPHGEPGAAHIGSFLHPDVVYKPSPHRFATGRDAVVRLCREVREAFDVYFIEIANLNVGDAVTLVEHTAWVKLEGAAPQELMGFSSFRVTGHLISEWHQVHA
jgi:hypothetical protein